MRRAATAAALATALAACAPAIPPPAASVAPAAAPEPVRRAWPVMGTLLEVSVWEADSARAVAALHAARAAVFRVDTLMSVYKPESELAVVNRRAGSDTVTVVSAETGEVLEAALHFARLTGGALDVTAGPLVDSWGFYRHQGRIPPRATIDSARALVGWRRLEWKARARAVRLPEPGMRLDFGAIAKGYAVDQAVRALREHGVQRGMVDLGGNLRVFGPPPRGGWALELRDPRDPEVAFASVALDSGAVATSGDYEQFFEHQGVRYSHIFDPRTGWPTRGVAGVSVIAPTAMQADALSTALFVLGPEEGCRALRQLGGVGAVWVRDGTGASPAAGRVVYSPEAAGRLQSSSGEAAPAVPCSP